MSEINISLLSKKRPLKNQHTFEDSLHSKYALYEKYSYFVILNQETKLKYRARVDGM
jgi:hypothetical protein